MKSKNILMVTLLASTLALSGCGAMSTAIKKRNSRIQIISATLGHVDGGTVSYR